MFAKLGKIKNGVFEKHKPRLPLSPFVRVFAAEIKVRKKKTKRKRKTFKISMIFSSTFPLPEIGEVLQKLEFCFFTEIVFNKMSAAGIKKYLKYSGKNFKNHFGTFLYWRRMGYRLK